jgi:dihydropteroate synthase
MTTPPRATDWQLPRAVLSARQRPLLMGIVNVTPDSFSDGGQYLDPGAAVEHGLRLAAEGADLLDIGGESTRPYAAPVAVDDELRRVVPVVEQLCRQISVPISIDTTKAAVARAALDAGAQVINDISGLEHDPGMLPLAVASGAAVCAMHMQGTPQTMQDHPTYGDVVAEIHHYLRLRREALLAAGIALDRIALDPGIGFGKTHQHNLTLLAHCREFHDLGCPLLVGHSRKGFIAHVLKTQQLGTSDTPRVAGTIGVALALAQQRVQILRVHDVGPVRQALALYQAVSASDSA